MWSAAGGARRAQEKGIVALPSRARGSVATFSFRGVPLCCSTNLVRWRGGRIDFKGSQFEREIILWTVRGIVNLLASHTVCQSWGMDTLPVTTTIAIFIWVRPDTRNNETTREYLAGMGNVRITKCEMIQYRVCKKTMTAIWYSHVRLGFIKLTMPKKGQHWDVSTLNPNRQKFLARLGRKYTAQALRRMGPERR